MNKMNSIIQAINKKKQAHFIEVNQQFGDLEIQL